MAKKKTSNRKPTAKQQSVKVAKKGVPAKSRARVATKKATPRKARVVKSRAVPAKKATKSSRKVTDSAPVVDYARAKRALDKYREQLKALGKRVTGVSIGPRFKDGDLKKNAVNEMVIRLQVATEEDKKWLKDQGNKIGYQEDYDGVDTDIVVWNFKTSSTDGAVEELPDGEAILGPGGRGTLGTKVIIRLNGKRTAVWLTAAHVASKPIKFGEDSVEISRLDSGLKIGDVSKDHYFRGDDTDVAFIVPENRLSTITPFRIISPPKMNLAVTMTGGVTKNAKGKIVSMDVDGEVTSPGGKEKVVDHFHVQGIGSSFAVKGDSGGLVVDGDELIGIVRAADIGAGIAVVTRLDNVHDKTLEFSV